MLLRFGFYCSFASKELGDHSYYLWFMGRAHEVTPAIYWEVTSEIHARLVQAGKIAPDEDPYEREMRS